ncbi:MAG: TM2 domain-containing protein, partial [Melioribacteraceae bacterium]|nr:TM2 domain-containing protein [Melioribacteraceae bacterium]
MKSRKTAILLSIIGGGVGVHKFYLNDAGSGIFYIMLTVFSAALGFPIGWILGWIDAFAFMTMS